MTKVTISEFIIALLELLEVQIQEVQKQIHKSAWGVGYILISSLLFFVGILFLLWAFKLFLTIYFGEIISLVIIAILFFAGGFLFSKIASKVIKKDETKTQ